MTEPISNLMQRWRDKRYGEYDVQQANDAITISDHACEVLPKVREALELCSYALTGLTAKEPEALENKAIWQNCVAARSSALDAIALLDGGPTE